jgi:hypothetical protein
MHAEYGIFVYTIWPLFSAAPRPWPAIRSHEQTRQTAHSARCPTSPKRRREGRRRGAEETVLQITDYRLQFITLYSTRITADTNSAACLRNGKNHSPRNVEILDSEIPG